MFHDRGLRVLAADLDPQGNLTTAFVDENRLELSLFSSSESFSLFDALRPLKVGTGDVGDAHIENIEPGLGLLMGDMELSMFEDSLSEAWPKCSDGDERAFRVTSAFWRLAQQAAARHEADVVLLDVGPNLGAINRAALIASDSVVIPLGPDLFSLQGMRNLGPTLRTWRKRWAQRLEENPSSGLTLPPGRMEPIGYIVLRHSIRLDRPVQAFERWIGRIPDTYAKSILQQPPTPDRTIDDDPNCIAKLKDYRSLAPLAQEARKPMFHLKPADGALGGT